MWKVVSRCMRLPQKYMLDSDAAILCAAVADFRPATVASQKIKREGNELVVRLQPTYDIAAALW